MKFTLRGLRIGALLLALQWAAGASAQTTAPDWTLTDVYGEQHHLQSTLDSGYAVILHFQFAWDVYGWGFHNSGVLEEAYQTMGPSGSDVLRVFMIEVDPNTTESALFGGGSVSLGNWVEGVSYPVIDGGAEIGPLYDVYASPTIKVVCPEGWMTDVSYGNLDVEQALASICSFGCTHVGACNFNPSAVHDAANCWFPGAGRDCAGNCLVDCNGDGVCDLNEDFESYQPGDTLAYVSPMWQTWSAPPFGGEHVTVTEELSQSGTQCMRIDGYTTGGTVDDMVFKIECAGRSYVEFAVLVPEGYTGYYNLQTGEGVGEEWGLNAFFRPDGFIEFRNDENEFVAEHPFAADHWFRIEHEIDIESGWLEVSVNGCLACQFPFVGSQLMGINFYGSGVSGTFPKYYVDDIRFKSGGIPLGPLARGCMESHACNFDAQAVWSDGSCCFCDDASLYQTWQFSSNVGAIQVGPVPGSGEFFTSETLPLEQFDDAWTFYPDGRFEYHSNGESIDPNSGYLPVPFDPIPSVFHLVAGDSIVIGNFFDPESAALGCGWLGTWDSGPSYAIQELTDSTLIVTGQANGGDCSTASEAVYFTFTFEPSPVQYTDAVAGCATGCMDPVALNFEASAQSDDGSCFYGLCDEVGQTEWDALGLGFTTQGQDSLPAGETMTHQWSILVPAQIQDATSGATYQADSWGNLSIAGLPEGVSITSLPDAVSGGTQACFEVTGTPVTTGEYPVAIVGDLYINILGSSVFISNMSSDQMIWVVESEGGPVGCTYASAQNFDAAALSDDGSCLFDAVNPCPEDLNSDGVVTISDLLALLAVFGDACPG